MKKEFLTNCVECGKEVWERGEIVKGFFGTEGVKYEKEPICADCLIKKNIENGYTKGITNLKKGEKKMKILLILALFLGGCAVEPAVVKDSGGNEIPWTPLEPSKKCVEVPLEERELGEMRSVSIIPQENNYFLYDFTCLGLSDESYNYIDEISVFYYENKEGREFGYIALDKEGVSGQWAFNSDYYDIVYLYKQDNFFKNSIENVDYSIYTQRISIVIKNMEKRLYYKGLHNGTGKVQLVGIFFGYVEGYCEGDCDAHTPYVPIPEP